MSSQKRTDVRRVPGGRRTATPVERRNGAHPEVEGPEVEDESDVDADIEIDDELTAQPSQFDSDVTPPVPETGLSVEPEDLGRQALVDATQQDNFESLHEDGDVGIHVINPHLADLSE